MKILLPWVYISGDKYDIVGRDGLYVRYHYKDTSYYVCWVGKNIEDWSYNWCENYCWESIKHNKSKNTAMEIVDKYFTDDGYKLLDQKLLSLL